MPSVPTKVSSGNAHVRLFPRRKIAGGEVPEKGRAPLKVDAAAIKALFGLPQSDAAQAIGVSLTALKQTCRKLGIQRWPYQRPRKSGRKAAPASPVARASQPAAPRRSADEGPDAATGEHLSESETLSAETDEDEVFPSAASSASAPVCATEVDYGCHADDGLCPPAIAASSDASYHFHQRGDDHDLLTLQLRQAQGGQPGSAADNDEGDDLSWMAVAFAEQELSYDRNWQPYYYAVTSMPMQPRIHERCEATPLFGPGDASGEFSRACGDALHEALSAQATAHNSPVTRPAARTSPLPHLYGMDSYGMDSRRAVSAPRVAKLHSDDLAYAPPVGMPLYARAF